MTATNVKDDQKSISNEEAVFIGGILNAMAAGMTSSLASFSGWMTAAFGGFLGLVLSNLEAISRFVPVDAVRHSMKLYVVIVALHLVQRYLGTIVASSIAAGEESARLPFPPAGQISTVLRELEKATFPPARWLIQWSNERVLRGDLAVAGRMNAKSAQLQAWLVFFQLILVLSAIWELASALQG